MKKEKKQSKDKTPKGIQKGKYGVFQGSLVRNSDQEQPTDTLHTKEYRDDELTITTIQKKEKKPKNFIELNSSEINRKKVSTKGPLIFRIVIYIIIAILIIAMLLFFILI
ncbi:hypothetical protein SSABA_v1c06880 [Spiroplasma sabaudiense Ar-1343]|uniref:Transmembrane protein n=1 Tax=Spiroplasma sabaudiense Ar-1343 TaxID=1276257 RepID=W6AB54_9MOLU|nr:hypothetical protein [Spiroplasma sabaudiense]AHI54090.1 hypothetical protein SSABA_v1c06880 [Spiroplasma sabaudiense Ar-1343]